MISHPLQALPGTAVEAQAILALFPNAESLPLYGFDATRDRLLGEVARGARVIHIATHAYADIGDPRLSYVALSSVDREGGAINGILLAGEIMSSSINADLVTLSGCETHIGEPLFGEGLRGLSQAWIQAGARTVVGSLWKVSDDATQVLMRNFYSQLDRGRVRPSRALRAAQLAVLKDDRYSRPYHWASFVPMTTSMD
jgi:CHAT domain-containing protein